MMKMTEGDGCEGKPVTNLVAKIGMPAQPTLLCYPNLHSPVSCCRQVSKHCLLYLSGGPRCDTSPSSFVAKRQIFTSLKAKLGRNSLRDGLRCHVYSGPILSSPP